MRRRVHHTIGILCLAVLVALALFATPAVSSAQAMRAPDDAVPTTTLDADRDGLVDALEGTDTDRDGVVDALDVDDDNDGIPTREERPAGADRDTDRDGAPDHRDADDDGDGVPTRDERDGDVSRDADGDGWADHLDARDDGVLTSGTIAADIDGDGRADVLDERRPAAPARRPTNPVSLALTALALGAAVTRRRG